MKITALFSAAALAMTTVLAATPNCPPRQVTPAEQLTIFKDFVKLFYVIKDIPTAFQSHVAESYIQHNPNFLSGRQIAQDGLAKYIPPLNITVTKISLSDNNGWVMAKQVTEAQKGTGQYTVVVDVFRMDGSCVVEHWDVVQPKPTGAKNPLAMFDGQVFGNAV
jgi:predicted SnoaL-like aldol condensation-catalyzing enzyme